MSPLRTALLSLTALLLLISATGCKSGPPTIGDPPPRLADGEAERGYKDVLGRFTGTGEVYTGFDTQLFAGATYQSWEFRKARVERVAQFKSQSKEEVEKLLAEERAEWEQFHVFELGTWTREPRFDDFDRKNSIWRIALRTDTVELLPSEVLRVQRVNQDARALYPYMGEFWVRYRVMFPRRLPDGSPSLPDGTKDLTLRVASTLGRADLKTRAE